MLPGIWGKLPDRTDLRSVRLLPHAVAVEQDAQSNAAVLSDNCRRAPLEPASVAPSDDWTNRIVAAERYAHPATADDMGGDPANAGIRREPELPEHEEIVAPTPSPAQEFDLLDEDLDVDAAKAKAMRARMRIAARQASLDPGDGIEL